MKTSIMVALLSVLILMLIISPLLACSSSSAPSTEEKEEGYGYVEDGKFGFWGPKHSSNTSSNIIDYFIFGNIMIGLIVLTIVILAILLLIRLTSPNRSNPRPDINTAKPIAISSGAVIMLSLKL